MKMAINFAGVNKITITCVLYDEIYFDFSCSKKLQLGLVTRRQDLVCKVKPMKNNFFVIYFE
jgi:hypothetical protein